ncbi:MAG: CotH kinase family protein [Anaerolineaceae bacterium]|nr:CotH kinase family protein [Anaerolineaceae bacterium]
MRHIVTTILGLSALLTLGANVAFAQDESITRPAGWDESTHGKLDQPDYTAVFPQDAVNTITITINPENWQAALDDMTELYGEFGAQPGQGSPMQPPGDGAFPGNVAPPDGAAPPQGGFPGQPPGQMGVAPGGIIATAENPIWIPADISFNGQTWTNVGFRFKGNSSLMSTWSSGIYKLPFKLDFDEFEDDYPEINNQRFYGFKQLSFSSNWSDDSLLREKVTADIFREAGIPSAQTAFYAVYVDYGEDPVYFGLYTAVEVVDDTVIKTQFADDSGNVYKPEGTGATFAAGTYDEAAFDKETNADEADYSDVLALYNALNTETRTTDPAAWRSGLEAVFDVAGFMHWLAVNTVVQNWDTYGSMSHNFYLYNDPTTGLLTWIPWDNNMALWEGMSGGRHGGGIGGTVTIDLESVSSDWPLIRYLMDDPIYHALYVQYVAETINGVFNPAKMEATYQTLHDLIAPYVVGENGEQSAYTNLSSAEVFDTALADLISHVNARYAVVQDYLSSQVAQ